MVRSVMPDEDKTDLIVLIDGKQFEWSRQYEASARYTQMADFGSSTSRLSSGRLIMAKFIFGSLAVMTER